ncbi:MAG: nuclear transport factor 2 family protein [Candidatus Aminicenantes bacterium]|nr:MAG: nuclear transport factor 2 family protein [Candidatus Aminicenantes bacterium]
MNSKKGEINKMNLKCMKIFLVFVCFLLMIQACRSKTDLEKELNNLMQTDLEFSQFSVENGAAEAFKMYFMENAVQLPSGQNPILGRDKIYEDMLNAGTDYMLSWEPQDGETSSSGDMGYTWGIYTLSFQGESGEIKTQKGKYLNVWKKDNQGNWRVIVDMGNQNPN